MIKQYKIITFSLICLLCSCIKEEALDTTPTGVMESLWTIIDEKYCFIEEKGINWDSIHTEYKEKTSQISESDQIALFDTLSNMLENLKDGHVNLYTDFDTYASKKWYEDYPTISNEQILFNNYLTSYRIAGGALYTELENGKVGYIKYSSFSNYVSQNNLYYIYSSLSKDNCGLIIDMRQNTGGSIEYALDFAASFFEKTDTVGYSQHKIGKKHDALSEPQPIIIDSTRNKVKYLRPVVVLCDRMSYSATNIFISVMRKSYDCHIVGCKSGGGGGMPLSYELNNGWLVRFSSVKMTDFNHQSIEDGIEPDTQILLTSTDKDDLIEYSINYLINKRTHR